MENPYASPGVTETEAGDRGWQEVGLKERFSLSREAWIVFALGIVVVLAVQPFQATGSMPLDRLPGYVMGKLVGLLIFSLTPALVVFYASRRSRKAASITFIVVVILAMLGQVGEAIGDLRASANRPQPFVGPGQTGE